MATKSSPPVKKPSVGASKAKETAKATQTSTPPAADDGSLLSNLWRGVTTVLRPLASLRLTVVLFALGIVIVFIGTLAQDKKDMWEVIDKYFRSYFVWVELQDLFPSAWFPNMEFAVFDLPVVGETPIGFPFFGGITIGLAMFVNLLAAHLVRFKTQARGVRLASGLAVLVFGAAATWLVIESGHNRDGLQGQPLIGGEELWLALQVSFVAGLVALVGGLAYTAINSRFRFRAPMWIAATALGLGLLAAVWVFGPGADLGQDSSSMRILWQLLKAQGAAAVLMLGCWLAFKQRGGIVLIHGGVGLMMIGELLVGTYAVEEQITMSEGQAVNFAQDIRAVELAVVDTSPKEFDDVVVIPAERNGAETRFVRQGVEKQQPIRHADLPFDIEFVSYLRNSDLRRAQAGDKNPATHGEGLRRLAVPVRTGAGADQDSTVDLASAYVALYEKTEGGAKGKKLGVYLVSVMLSAADMHETVTLGDKTWRMALRFKRTYKPYTLRLIDVRKDDYIGTDTPRNYSSDVHLVDRSRNEDRDLHIWMNNPVRYAGETFYQSGYNRDQAGNESTTLQVVANTGWMIPYTACMLVFTGMLAHFAVVLLRFLNRQTAESLAGRAGLALPEGVFASPQGVVEAEVVSPAAAKGASRLAPGSRLAPDVVIARPSRSVTTADVAVPAITVLLFAGMVLFAALPRSVKKQDPDVVAFGRLPVAYEGRVKPYDTVARTTLRAISGKESFEDAEGKRQPASRWLLDVISHSPQAEKHKVFRIEHFDVLNLLGLSRRKGYRYSFAEFSPKIDEFREQVDLAAQANRENPEKMTLYQKKVLELDRKLRLYLALRESHRLPEADTLGPLERANYLTNMAALSQELRDSHSPLAAPYPPSEEPWEPLPAAATRVWIADMAKKRGAKNSQELADKLAAEITAGDASFEDKFVEARMLQTIEGILHSQHPEMSGEQLQSQSQEMLASMPADVRTSLEKPTREAVRRELLMLNGRLKSVIDEVLSGVALDKAAQPAARAWIGMLSAWRAGEASRFNRHVEQYQQMLAKNPPADYHRGNADFEAFFNRFNPFLQCEVMYITGFVLASLSWLFWRRPLNWASFSLIAFALLVHSAALIGRIIIYGRPPVTNLYSSAIFIGWGAVVLGLVLELFFRIGVGNIVAAICGFSTLLIAPSLAADGDTFTVMQAVLDTNFWLATHVVTITLGYSTTFVAGILGVLFVAGGVFTPALSANLKRTLYRMTYGIVCFAIFFSFIGTVLGGLWADDSWGRFWGWDPKENGALIIVLWNAIVLHARWGGLVKERGLAVLAIGGNIVTAWSWFGVNELGVGLHSYGFTEGRLVALAAFMTANLALVGIGMIPKSWWWSNKATIDG